MNISQNEKEMRKQRREKLVSRYRKVTSRMDVVFEELIGMEHPAKKFDELYGEYRSLNVDCARMEKEMKEVFGTQDIESIIYQ